MLKALFFSLQLSLGTALGLFASPLLAQVTTDGTVNTQVNQNGNVAEITGGETRGSNLFHSFQDFSVGAGNEAFFNNADNISDIFSRVTGGNISNIDGLIRANGTANLFLINPAGIVFGEGARLDIGGSFLGTTSSSILFEDGEFSAVDNLNQPILTINAPIGLNFRDEPGDIVNNSVASADFDSEPSFDDNLFGIRVPDGKTFALAGGNITLDGGRIVAVGGKIELGAVGDSGTLNLDFEDDNISFGFFDSLARANVSLSNNASLFVTGFGGGNIAITANDINILSGSNLIAGIIEGSQLPNSQAGDIILNALENIEIASSSNSSGISNQVGNVQVGDFLVGITTQGSAGNIIINSNTFEGNGNFLISSVTSGLGDAGEININAAESVSFTGNEENSSGIFSFVGASATGNGGDVAITTPSLSIVDSSLVLTTIGNGDTGDIRIKASDSIIVRGSSQFQSTSLGNGNAGNISIDASDANITFENPNVLVTTSVASIGILSELSPELVESITSLLGIPRTSTGSSGNINVIGRTFVLNDGATFSTSTAGEATAEGLSDAGDININVSDSLILSNNSELVSSSAGQGNAGNVNIIAGGDVSFEGMNNNDSNGITTSIVPLPTTLAEGFTLEREGGDISIRANSFSLTNGSQIVSSTLGIGNAGNISIDVDNGVVLDGIRRTNTFPSGLQSNVESEAIGNGGVIEIESRNLSITDGAQIQTVVRGSNASQAGGNGIGGNINIDVEETLRVEGFSETVNINGLDNNSTSLVSSGLGSGATGQSGNIAIRAGSLSLTEGGQILSNTLGGGGAGNITVDVENDVVLDGTGQGIRSGEITTLPSGFFSSVAEFAIGNGGNIDLTLGDRLILRQNSIISAEAFNDGNGGNINIDSNFVVAFPNETPENGSDIIANAASGDGGNINITAESLFGIVEREALVGNGTNDIDARSDFGLDGSISISTPDLNPIERAAELPTNLVEQEQTTAQACANDRGTAARNSFTIKGKGGVVPDPALPLNSLNPVNSETDAASDIPAPIETASGKIQLARGIEITESGEVRLVAYRTNDAGDRIREIKPNCGSL